MTTALITHTACLEHVTPPGHPERVDRLRAVLAALEGEEFQNLLRIDARPVTREQLARAHDVAHIAAIESSAPAQGWRQLDADTYMSAGSLEAARFAAGAVVEAVDMVLSGEVRNVFCAIRPPGHHAERHRPMGFCLFSNAAIGALHALEAHGLSRVAVLDFDVHHGNGTQQIVERDPRVFFAGSHQWPLWPGTGAEHEVGVGNVVNVCLPPLSGSVEFREAWAAGVLAPLERFRPELVIVSAGFDAHGDDPLAQLLLHERDFAWVTDRICEAARRHCAGRVVSTLEGGYDLGALARSAAAHVRALMAHGAVG